MGSAAADGADGASVATSANAGKPAESLFIPVPLQGLACSPPRTLLVWIDQWVASPAGFRASAVACGENSVPSIGSRIRQVVDTTNAIESLNARFRRAVRHRKHFPTEQAALKVLDLAAIERKKNRGNPTGRINAWKPILNTLTIHYRDPITAAN